MIIAITSTGVGTGLLRPANAAALVGAGVVSVLCFPLLADVVARRRRPAAELVPG